MCFSAESSITTLVVSFSLSYLLFTTGNKYDKTIAIFCLAFGSMQFAEYLMWMDQECGEVNNFASILGNVILFLQPLSILIAGYYYKSFHIPQYLLLFLIILSSYSIVKLTYNYIKSNKKLCSLEKESGNLDWVFINGGVEDFQLSSKIFYYSILFFTWFFMKDRVKGVAMGIWTIFFFLIAGANFKQWESIWCYIANITPLIFLFLQN
jgi:hypothetical protein